MERIIELIIPGKPRGKQRPKHTINGHTYTPAPTREYEDNIRALYLDKYREPMFAPKEALFLNVVANFPIAKSDSKKTKLKKSNGEISATVKPDIDNIVKIVADALNGIAYADDSQIVKCTCEKRYSVSPSVEIRIGRC